MSRIFWGKGGFTLIELLVAMLFAGIVVAALYGFFREQLFNLLSQETKTATLEEVRGALNLIARELRNAGAWATGAAPAGCSRIVSATATAIQVQADVDGSGDCADAATGEDVTYELSGGTSICPGSVITRNGDCLVANVVIPSANNFLTYYSAGSTTPLSFPITDLTTIKRIKITFSVQENNPSPTVGGTISSTLSSSVVLRND